MDDSMTTADNARLVAWFEEAESLTYDARKLQDRDDDYYNGNQITAEVRAELKKRKQPVIVNNLIKPEIDYLAGVEKSQRVDPKAYPRTPDDAPAAFAATQGLRFVVDDNIYDNLRSMAWKGLLKPGVTAAKVGAKEGREGMDPEIKVFSYDRFFYDPHSSELDFSDARYMGFVTWMDYDAALQTYGDEAKPILDVALATQSNDDHFDDKPRFNVWGDAKRRRVRMVEIYYIMGGIWYEAIFTKGGDISNQHSPYIDEDGQPENPIIAQTAYIDRENNRYGQVREMVDPQDDYNKRRSKATHILNSRQVIADKNAVDDPNKARRELARPDAFIEVNPGKKFDINGNMGLEAGQFQLMQEAAQMLKSNSIKNSMIGGNDQSGRAKQAQQQAAMMEIGDLLDNLRHFDKRIFQACWNRIKQFWDGPRWIRITDDPENVQHLGLNVPLNPMTGQPLTAEEKQFIQSQPPMIDQQGNLIDPMASLPMQNPVAMMNVDLRIEEAPDVASLQDEENERWMAALPTFAQMGVPANVLLEVTLETMPHSRSKDKMKQMLGQMQEQPAPPDPMAEKMKEIAVADAAANVDETQAKTRETEAKTIKLMQEARATVPEQIPVPVPVPVAANQY